MPRGPRRVAAAVLSGTLLLAGAVLLTGGIAAAQDPSASPAPSAPATSPLPVPSVDPCASPLPSPAASTVPAESAAPSSAPSAAPSVAPDASVAPEPSTAPVASAAPCGPAASPEPSAEPSAEPTDEPTGKIPKAKPVTISLRKVADGFENPNGIFNAGDDRLFVADQLGYVSVLKPNKDGTFRNAGTFLDITDRVACCGEKGFLGLAFPPDYKESGKFYVTYAGAGHQWYLDEMRVSKKDPDQADKHYRRNLIHIYKPHDFHWGGDMYFGPDGYLWIGMGDGGFGGRNDDPGDPENRAQDLSQIFGKFLRIDPKDPDGKGKKTAKYGIPEDNPYVGVKGAAPEIWLRGVRNPWRWSFDSATGDLWVTDVGFHKWEEVDRLKAPKTGKGANLGWRLMEGPICYNPAVNCQDKAKGKLTKPIVSYEHVATPRGYQCAVTGGFVYRGKLFPAMRSWYFFGDYCSGQIFQVDSAGPDKQPLDTALDTDFLISTMGTDANGEIYVADYTLNKETAIYRLEGKPKR
ncbi:MAG: PQQ-dependent sugar dehydrogenase [Chloroflexota bacterium]